MARRYYLLLISCLVALASPTFAAQLDAPVVASQVQGRAKVVVYVVAGQSGAPAGFTIQWMRFSDFLANGQQFFETPNEMQSEAQFTGIPTLNTWGGTLTTFTLESSATAAVEIGDLFDETGISASAQAEFELQPNTPYIFRGHANGDEMHDASAWSNSFVVNTTAQVNCTYTQGFWKTHSSAWPVSTLTLGTVTYNQAQLLLILDEPAHGNGLVILAHQLIATLLNLAQGADGTVVSSTIASSQAMIGSLLIPPIGGDSLPSNATSTLTQHLDDYNNGIIGPGHCGAVAVEPNTWSRVKASYR